MIILPAAERVTDSLKVKGARLREGKSLTISVLCTPSGRAACYYVAVTSRVLPGRVDQIAFVVPDLDAVMDAYHETLGVTFGVFEVDESTSAFSGSSKRFRIRIAVALAGSLTIELIQPVSGHTLYSRHLESGGSGVHHVGIYVDDVAAAARSLAGTGRRSILKGRIHGLGEFTYFEIPAMHCVVELLQLSLTFPVFLASRAKWHPSKFA